MCMNETSQNDCEKSILSKSFMCVCILTVIVCLFGMIYCCISFVRTSEKFSNECEEVLLIISSSTSSDTSSEIAADSSSSLLSDNTSETRPNISSDTSSDRIHSIDSLITHMESMIAIQKSGMTNDLMSFIYGILSTILVGLCAGFVVKSRANADDAKKNTDIAIKQAMKAANMAKGIENAINQADDAVKSVKELRFQIRLIIISSRIVSAKLALNEEKGTDAEKASANRTRANREIKQINEEIVSLFSDDDCSTILNGFDNKDIEKVSEELEDLRLTVNTFRTESQKNYKGEELTPMINAADNYSRWIDDAISCMDNKRIPKTI